MVYFFHYSLALTTTHPKAMKDFRQKLVLCILYGQWCSHGFCQIIVGISFFNECVCVADKGFEPLRATQNLIAAHVFRFLRMRNFCSAAGFSHFFMGRYWWAKAGLSFNLCQSMAGNDAIVDRTTIVYILSEFDPTTFCQTRKAFFSRSSFFFLFYLR